VAPSLLGLLAANRRQRADVRLFEIGKGYLPERANERGEPREVHELGLAWALARGAAAARWDETALARLRGVLAHLLDAAGVEAPRWERGAADGAPVWMHPGKWLRADWGDGAAERPAIVVGELEPGVARALELAGELDSDVAVACVSIDALRAAPRRGGRYRPIPRFPSVKVDVALAVDDALPAGALEAAIVRAGKNLVERVELFDVYRGESLGAGKKSLAYHVVLAASDRTLTDADAARFLARLERECAALGAELRKD
jgi:phenylalanyl-tRNA synthetase beta chain